MNLPGLGLDELDDTENQDLVNSQIKVDLHNVSEKSEWRFEVAVNRSISVKLLKGTAELFGTELITNHAYVFVAVKAAIYTWTGCTIEVTYEQASLTSEYVAQETTVMEYINTHFALESMREKAETTLGAGPRLLVLGSESVGKTALAKTLTAYALRNGRSPLVVNLNPNEGMLSLPGTLSTTVFKTMLEVESDAGGGWGSSPMSGPNGEIPVKLPLVYYFGGLDPHEKKGALYKSQVTRLALSTQGRMDSEGQSDVKASGVIIDTPGSLVGASAAANNYELVAHIVSEFQVNAIVCLGNERLYNDLVKKFDRQPSSLPAATADSQNKEYISVIKLPKSGGVVDRDAAYMRNVREAQIKAYFYGNPKVGAGISLQPRQQPVDFDTLPTVYRRISTTSGVAYSGFNNKADEEETFLPGDADDAYEPTMSTEPVAKVPLPASQLFERVAAPTPALKHCIIAVMNCSPDLDPAVEQETLRDASVMGFLYVTDIDESKGRISFLSPVAGRIPNRALVWGEGMEGVLGVVG